MQELEDETLVERLYGLTEMFPNWFIRFCQNSFQYSKYFGQFLKKSIWFCSSSFVILILPILVQFEFSQVTEMQAAQTRQVKSLSTNHCSMKISRHLDSSWTNCSNWSWSKLNPCDISNRILSGFVFLSSLSFVLYSSFQTNF